MRMLLYLDHHLVFANLVDIHRPMMPFACYILHCGLRKIIQLFCQLMWHPHFGYCWLWSYMMTLPSFCDFYFKIKKLNQGNGLEWPTLALCSWNKQGNNTKMHFKSWKTKRKKRRLLGKSATSKRLRKSFLKWITNKHYHIVTWWLI